MTVIFIGGASRVGKTFGARWLGQELDVPVLHLDTYAKRLRDGSGVQGADLHKAARIACDQMLCHLLVAQARCLVEGWWLFPERAAKMRAAGGFFPIFCGCVSTTPSRQQAFLADKTDGAWYRAMSSEDQLVFLEQQQKDSHRTLKACEGHGLPFVDMSDPDVGLSQLEGTVRSVLSRT